MPVGMNEIYPFLAAVIAGRTVKEIIGSRISLVDQRNEIVFHCSFLSHIESKLSVHSF